MPTATATSGVRGGFEVALVVAGRRSAVEARLRSAATGLGLGPCRVIRGRGRRAGAREGLVAEVLEDGISTVVVSSLSGLHPSPSRALGIAAALMNSNVTVVSLEQPWLSTVGASAVASVATFLMSEEQRSASVQGRRAISLVRKSGGSVGRPRKALPVPADEALRLVKERGWRAAGRAIGISPGSVRRALERAGLISKSGERRTA